MKNEILPQLTESQSFICGTGCGEWEPESVERHLREQIALAKTNLEALVGFTDAMFSISFQGGDADAATIQELGVAHGLLSETTATEPCGERCACAEVNEFPMTCYRKGYL